jgi:hypothetical protein
LERREDKDVEKTRRIGDPQRADLRLGARTEFLVIGDRARTCV